MEEPPASPPSESQAYEVALVAALHDLNVVRARIASSRATLQTDEDAEAELKTLILGLAARLPKERRDQLFLRAHEILGVAHPTPRATPLFDSILQLFQSSTRRAWRTEEVREALARNGNLSGPKSEKQMRNVLDHLVRSHRLKRVARGHYLLIDLPGTGLVTSEEIRAADHSGRGEHETD